MTILRLSGVPVQLHWTFVLVIGGFLLWSLSVSGLAGAVTAAAWVGVLFGSVLFHEIGHAWMAARHGVRTRSIVLLPIGGAAELEMRAVSPASDAWISVAGPVASLVLAGVGLGLWGLTGWQAALGFGGLNLALGLFNLLPAFPMDGGRILRAALVGRVGLDLGGRIALVVGIGFSAAFAGLGVVAVEPGLVAFAAYLGVLQWREHQVQISRRPRAA